MSDLDVANERLADPMANITLEDVRQFVKMASEYHKDWQGMPVPVDGLRIRLCEHHRLADKIDVLNNVYNAPAEPIVEHACHIDDDGYDVIVNSWRHRRRHAMVHVVRDAAGRSRALVQPLPPDGSMRRLMLGLNTIGAADAWTVDAEVKAMEKLQSMVTDRKFRQYLLTGTFLEESPRSGLIYVLRRLRPTIAMTPRWPERKGRGDVDVMRCLAVLCMHPVGYYEDSWAGCMTPTDDVIAHLLMIRADEAGFWGQANQHDPAAPEAGL